MASRWPTRSSRGCGRRSPASTGSPVPAVRDGIRQLTRVQAGEHEGHGASRLLLGRRRSIIADIAAAGDVGELTPYVTSCSTSFGLRGRYLGWLARYAAMVSFWSADPSAAIPVVSTTSIDCPSEDLPNPVMGACSMLIWSPPEMRIEAARS